MNDINVLAKRAYKIVGKDKAPDEDLDTLISILSEGKSDYITGDAIISMQNLMDALVYLKKLKELTKKDEDKYPHYLITQFRDNPCRDLDDLMRWISHGNYADEDHDFVCVNYDMLKDALGYLNLLKLKLEEPPLGKKPDYAPLGFHELADMIGEPVYVKSEGCKGKWEIVRAVEKDCDGEYIRFKGECDYRMRITDEIYRTKKGAEENG